MTVKNVLITGASAGIGRACAHRLQALGHTVFGASRRGSSDIPGVIAVAMNVDDDDSVAAGVRDVLQQAGRIDVLVNCAGFGIAGAIEDTSLDEAKGQLETNFFGTARTCRAVLPAMRQQQSGLIVNISSLGGLAAIPFQGYYSASKFAIEGFSEALRMEVKPFGIHVALIEPGDFATDFTGSRRSAAAAGDGSAYRAAFTAALATMENDERNGPAPGAIAELLVAIIDSPSPRLRHPAGLASQRLGIVLKRFLPAALFEDGVMRHFKLR